MLQKLKNTLFNYLFILLLFYICAMRQLHNILTLVLSLFFIAISMYPCADKYENIVSNYEVTVQQHADKTLHQDACSPLCTCSCCAVSLTVAKATILVTFPTTSINSKVNSIYQNSVNNLAFSIWQPPKILG